MTKRTNTILVAVLSLFAQSARAADALNYFKNYFVTGDAAVAGVGLRGTGVAGFATGTINMTAVPCVSGGGLSATVVPCTTAGAVPSDIIAAFLYWETDESAATPSATKGFFDGNAIVGKVLGNANNPGCAIFGGGRSSGRVYRADILRYLAIDQTHNVRLANGPHSVKLPDNGTARDGTVVLTGGATLVVVYRIVVPGNPAIARLRAVVLYDGSYTLTEDTPEMTQTVGGFYQASGFGATMTQIASGGESDFIETIYPNGSQASSSNLFRGSQGPRWDNPTVNVNLSDNASSFDTRVSAAGGDACLTFAAIVASTPVVDTDADGLLDVWETNGLHLNSGDATHPATFGGCTDFPSEPCEDLRAMGALPNKKDIFLEIDWLAGTDHVHTPKVGALTRLYNAFNAQGISVHFDVGTDAAFQSAGFSYIIPTPYAHGGLITDINESTLQCPNAKVTTCAYSEPYAVLGFKRGFRAVKDGFPYLGIPAHFSRDRKDIFHYVLFAHALAGPFDATGKPISLDPKSFSGVADAGDIMVTLGLWRSDIPANDRTGSELVQAGTLMHELGHNLGLSHAGLFRVPNCMPNYPSSMNYLYQTRGLTNAAGDAQVDFSRGTLPSLNELHLTSTPSLGILNYRVRYYGPFGSKDPPGGAAQLHCDGSPITDGALMIRLENGSLATPDWTHGVPGADTDREDINFNGTIGDGVNVAASQYFVDSNDWASINLQQVGARLNVNGLSADVGSLDLGSLDLGSLDLGSLDLGSLDLGSLDLGSLDLGSLDLGSLDLGSLDLGELDYETSIRSTVEAPHSTPSCPTCGLAATSEPLNTPGDIKLGWSAPENGHIDAYNVYRCAGASCVPSGPAYRSVPGGVALGVFIDTVNDFSDHTGTPCPAAATCYNTSYTYAVTSVVGTVESSYSNTATGLVKHLFVVADNKTRVYGSANPPFTFVTTGQDPGLSGVSTCITTATTASDVGGYPITCAGQTPVAGVTYVAGTLSITKATAVVLITPYNVVFDGQSHSATGTATGVGGANLSASLGLALTVHKDIGTYTDPWSFAGGIDYFDASGTVIDVIRINAVPFVTGFALNSPALRNDFSGFAGMQFTVGTNPIKVYSVGRVCVAGNSQTHTVKIVSASTRADVPGTAAAVNMAGCTGGQFVYADLASPLTLTAGTSYFLVSQEFASGDRFYEHGAIATKSDASVINSVFFNGLNWILVDSANTSYVPPDMRYAVDLPPPTAFVLNYNLDNQATRNNFTGFAGMNLRVGASALSVTSVGRACLAGNTQSHIVKFVNAATNQDVPGGSATVNMAGCTASQFAYAALAAPITLAANTQYYLVSQETLGGDRWLDQGALSTKPDATVVSSVFSSGATFVINSANTSYVPPNFLFSPVQGLPRALRLRNRGVPNAGSRGTR